MFNRGRANVENEPRSGQRKITTIPEIIQKIHNIVSENLSLTKREIADYVDISCKRLFHVLHYE